MNEVWVAEWLISDFCNIHTYTHIYCHKPEKVKTVNIECNKRNTTHDNTKEGTVMREKDFQILRRYNETEYVFICDFIGTRNS